MMNLQHITWQPFRLHYTSIFTTAHGVETARAGILLRLAAADGLVGLGEASPVTAFGGGTAGDALAAIGVIAPQLIGRDIDQADALLATLNLDRPGMAAVACALDTAICDLRARAAGLPIALLLGGAPGAPVAANATIGAALLD